MDLYRDARQYRQTLRGKGTVVVTADLPMTMNAARWREGRAAVNRVFRGCYVLGPSVPDLLDRCRAALAVAGHHAVVGFHTAAALEGFGVVESTDVHLVVPDGFAFPQRSGIAAHRTSIPLPTRAMIAGIACTAPARTAIDLARVLPRPRALCVLDAALSCRACTAEELSAEVALHKGHSGYRVARQLVAVADGRSQCVQESMLRLVIHDAGLTSFEPQVPVLDQYGDLLFMLDLADRELRVAAEYDGSSHLDRRRLRSDRARHNYLSTRGWRMRYFTDKDLYQRPHDIPATLRAAMVDARADPATFPRRR